MARSVDLRVGAEQFSIDCIGLTLGAFDVILGFEFLRLLGPILRDCDRLSMSFTKGGRHIIWSCLGAPGAVPPQPAACVVSSTPTQPLLDDLLRSSWSSPSRKGCHPPAPTTTASIFFRGRHRWRFGPTKDELERQCSAMLAQGIIRPSTSPFSALVLLVRKPDNSWRFCIDYRALNAKTSKDKFPIPVVDELLDELHGAHFFTKLDLRSGYHQVRMHPADVEKTAFRTHEGHYEFLVMLFSLSNTPATFQALMNDILRPYLRRFVLVFFDDILIYSRTWAEHLQHISIVLHALRDHQLHLKRSKCSFGARSVAYLGHVISADGVAMDAAKVEAVSSSSATSVSSRHLSRAFCARDAFAWDDNTQAAFQQLKTALTTGPVLQMPDFEKNFVVDCDASGTGFGAVLHQGAGPVVFFSRPFAARHLKLAAYERELIGLVQAVRHWRPYLWGRHFAIRTDHYSLKYLLDQRLSTVPQHQWLSKLFGFDFEVEYRPGRLNVAADALSRRDVELLRPAAGSRGGGSPALSGPSFAFLDDIRRATATSPTAVGSCRRLRDGTLAAPWRLEDGLLLHGSHVYVPDHGDLRHQAILLAHSAGHEGIQKTLHRLRAELGADVHDVPAEQDRDTAAVQPLEVPSQLWADISMDFIEGLPKVGGKSVILTVVDRFSKYAHFIPLGHPYTAASVARAFFDGVVRLHGFLSSIVSDRDPVFTGHVWRDLFKCAGVSLRMSTAFHPQTDGQSEVVNKVIAMYLRCVTGDRPRAWVDWLSWAEYRYNTSFHTALRGVRTPPTADPAVPAGSARTAAAEELLRDRDDILAEARRRLVRARRLSKRYYDAGHRDMELAVEDWVWLRLLHRPVQSLEPRAKGKLGPRYVGPFRVLEHIGKVAYRLELPEGARLHDVFHVGLLKRHKGEPPEQSAGLPPVQDGRLLPAPLKRRGTWHILVQWRGLSVDEATWEPREEFQRLYPNFQLEDELFLRARERCYDRPQV
ncbi:LOW QUALITY PROTEIN: hypothetical protein U9M48_003551 [Paspalum notatum var. saurae]|uniref:Uncharacterized protein n=1 Tax=Paspalum notatum var. saurae TaxID=547442 RepID=A0AAQ3PJ58_PASNO